MLSSPSSESSPTEPVTQSSVPDTPSVPATWPEWFRAADSILLILVLIVTFLTTSFAVRNSDFWLNIASGRLLAKGEFSPGVDPFSHASPDRPWVNWSWLTELGMYAVYSADATGAAVVAVKASIVVAAFALILFLRTPGQALWPWAVTTAVAVVASATWLSARPPVVSLLFLSLSYLLLQRWNWRLKPWRGTAILAALFAIWANCDGWFILGPVILVLQWIGELVRRLMEPEESSDSTAPTIAVLLRLLVCGTLACTLNPTFLASLTRSPAAALDQVIPAELAFSKPTGLDADPELGNLALTSLSGAVYTSAVFGGQPFGIAFALLLVAGAVVLAVGASGSRIPSMFIWIGLAAMTLLTVRMIPFFALVAVPITATHLNLLSSRINLKSQTDQKTRMLLLGCSVGRLLSIALALVLIFAAYPGWLLPRSVDSAYDWRVSFSVQPDRGMQRTAERLQAWRTEGRLPESFHGVHLSSELGNYLAWFAPNEKSFITSRWEYHWSQLPDLLEMRSLFRNYQHAEDTFHSKRVNELGEQWKADYLVTTSRNSMLEFATPLFLVFDSRDWTFWHLDGRAVVLGRNASRTTDASAFDRLRFSPVETAFGPTVEPVPDGTIVPVPPKEKSWEIEYLEPPAPKPIEADDVIAWEVYSSKRAERIASDWEAHIERRRLALATLIPLGQPFLLPNGNPPVAEEQLAIPVMMVRAARRAVAAAPDRPDGYLALAVAYRQPFATPSSDADRQQQIVTALARYLARVPAPEQADSQTARIVSQQAEQLARIYFEQRSLDLARDTLKTTLAYALRMDPRDFRGDPNSKDDPRKQRLEQLTAAIDQMTEQISSLKQSYQAVTDPTRRFFSAIQSGLKADAIAQFKSELTPEKAYGRAASNVAVALVELEVGIGRLEDASEDLNALQDTVDQLSDAERREEATAVLVDRLKAIQAQIARLAGDHTHLIEYRFKTASSTLPRLSVSEVAQVQKELVATPFAFACLAGPASLLPMRNQLVVQLSEVIRQEAATFIDCGMLALESGKLKEARKQFEQAEAPQGVPLEHVLTNAHLEAMLNLTAIYADPQQVALLRQQQQARFLQLRQSSERARLYLELIKRSS